jgi:hypothetical protein
VGPCESSPPNGRQIVDHELIAAGHPRLEFEFSAYLANLPKHWSQPMDQMRHAEVNGTSATISTFHFDAWVVGQETRAQQTKALIRSGGSVDFAQLDCFACHHDLASSVSENGENWRQDREYLGQLAIFQPRPPPPEGVTAALLAADADEQLKFLRNWWQKSNPLEWHSLVQQQLALDAWLADQLPTSHIELRECAAELRKILHSCFRHGEDATQYESPGRFRPDDPRLAANWQRINDLLQQATP